MSIFHILTTQIRATVKDPSRIKKLFHRRGWQQLKAATSNSLHLSSIPKDWVQQGNSFKSRRYDSYEQYVVHQQAKLATLDLETYDVKYFEVLCARLALAPRVEPHKSVLCLGARLGTEVRAFIDHGCFAIGIDLNPGPENRYMVVGDFHHIQYADQSVDIVFTNALDHVFDIDRIIAEIRRVLRPGGMLIIEAVRGTLEGKEKEPESFASFWWASVDDLIKLFEDRGFCMRNRSSFDYPWIGHFIVLERE